MTTPTPDEPLRLLIVCLGNICRSPMAEGALRARIEAAGLQERIVVDSVGTGGWHVGEPPDPRAIATAARYGVDIRGLRGRRLCADDFTTFDWLLCADRDVVRDVRTLAPRHRRDRVALLLEWAGQGAGAEIADPYTGRDQHFEAVWRQVDAAAATIVARSGDLAPLKKGD